MGSLRKHLIGRLITLITLIHLIAVPLVAQTKIEPPNNRFSPEDDVRLGREAAAEIARQLPLLPRNSQPVGYVSRVGQRLVRAIPQEFRFSQFRYEFNVVNASDVNAFALPGGPLYLNRGMIEAARNEGEMAGVMAHEIAHIALRHGTAQATQAQRFQFGALAGAILGSIVGGGWGALIQQGSQVGIGVYFLRYSREYERQADLLGAQIMARANYDPQDLANMFRTIEELGSRGGPEWLSSHPNPGNRQEAILNERAMLRVTNPIRDTADFKRVQAQLRQMPPAPSMAEIARSRQKVQPSPASTRISRARDGIELPASRYRQYSGGYFTVNLPENWHQLPGNNVATFAPLGAYGTVQDQMLITHGVQVGRLPGPSGNLRQSSESFIARVRQSNPHLQQRGSFRTIRIDGQPGLSVSLSGTSDITGNNEIVTVHTRQMGNQDLFYLITVAPANDLRRYRNAFNNISRSLRIGETRPEG